MCSILRPKIYVLVSPIYTEKFIVVDCDEENVIYYLGEPNIKKEKCMHIYALILHNVYALNCDMIIHYRYSFYLENI